MVDCVEGCAERGCCLGETGSGVGERGYGETLCNAA